MRGRKAGIQGGSRETGQAGIQGGREAGDGRRTGREAGQGGQGGQGGKCSVPILLIPGSPGSGLAGA